MAFTQPNAQRELTNRRILEELQLKKQMLLKQGAVAPLTATTISLSQPSPVSQLPMCSIPPVSATATQFEALESRLVLDAGCGPGALALGAAILGAGAVTAVDIDDDALQVFTDNVQEMETANVDAVLCDFLQSDVCRWENYFDTVLMNPPFGTKNNAGIDMKFLKRGLELSCDSVYSLHKSSTRSHIQKKIKEWGVKGSVIAELRYDLPATYRFHRQQSRDIAVDLWRLHHPHS